jgi:hypothetical protein
MGKGAAGDPLRAQAVHGRRPCWCVERLKFPGGCVQPVRWVPSSTLCAGKAAERVGFCRAQVGEGKRYCSLAGEASALSDAARFVLLRRRLTAPDSRPSFFSSSGLQPSLVART